MYDKSLWDGVLTSLEKTVDKKLIATWLKPAKIKGKRGDEIKIVVPNRFCKNWIDKNYLHLITAVLRDDFGIESEVRVICDETSAPSVKESRNEVPVKDNFSSIGSKLTFENFVSGESNGFAHSASLTVAGGNFSLYNPLYIYGGTGLGKTHLMYAIANRVRRNFPKINILYMDAETFSTEIINIFRKGEREHYNVP